MSVDRIGGALPSPLDRLFVAGGVPRPVLPGIVPVMPGPRRRPPRPGRARPPVHPLLPSPPGVRLGICTYPGADPEALTKALLAEIGALADS